MLDFPPVPAGEPAEVRLAPELSPDTVPLADLASLSRRWRPPAVLELVPGLRTLNRGRAIEVREARSGLSVQAGQLALPMGPDAGTRPSYIVLDWRPDQYLTAGTDREMGVQASIRPLRALGFTVGAYNNKASYKAGTLPVKDALTRVDVDLGFVQGGGFYYYGTGRHLGDRTKAGFDMATRIGPLELSGQVVHGMSYGIEQAGWFAAMAQQVRPTTRLVARLDQHDPNLRRNHGPSSHVIFAVVERLSSTRTLKLNLQAGLGDLNRAPVEFGPNNWAVIGQFSQRF